MNISENPMEKPLEHQSDKFFWHGYVDFYETFFKAKQIQTIAEIGIFKGNSIRWLLKRFPWAEIYGADILPIQAEWPVDNRFKFFQLDQGDQKQVSSFFSQKTFDLIIEDGSHQPDHQVLSLIEGVKVLKSGGLYILEDIHTSHPVSVRKSKKGLHRLKTPKGNALSVLLAIDHYKRTSIPIDESKAQCIAKDSIMKPEDVLFLSKNLNSIYLYKRTRLPDRCSQCGSVDYNFSTYTCKCGEKVFRDHDSMSFVLEKK